MEEAEPLFEMTEKVDQAEGFQEVYHLLDLHVLKEAMYVFKSPMMIESFPSNWFNPYSIYGRLSRVDGDKYNHMSRVHFTTDTISQLATFGPWKRVESTLHPSGRSLVTGTTPNP